MNKSIQYSILVLSVMSFINASPQFQKPHNAECSYQVKHESTTINGHGIKEYTLGCLVSPDFSIIYVLKNKLCIISSKDDYELSFTNSPTAREVILSCEKEKVGGKLILNVNSKTPPKKSVISPEKTEIETQDSSNTVYIAIGVIVAVVVVLAVIGVILRRQIIINRSINKIHEKSIDPKSRHSMNQLDKLSDETVFISPKPAQLKFISDSDNPALY